MTHDRRAQVQVDDALYIAQRVHGDEFDKRNRPYLMHVCEVAAAVGQNGDWRAFCVGILHDVFESGHGYALEDFDSEIQAAVDAITRLDGEPYRDYIRRVGQDRLAAKVKLADLRLNLATCPRETLKKRYTEAIEQLEVRQ